MNAYNLGVVLVILPTENFTSQTVSKIAKVCVATLVELSNLTEKENCLFLIDDYLHLCC